VLGAGGCGGGLGSGVLWFCVGGCWWLAGGAGDWGVVYCTGLFCPFLLPFFMCTTFWAGRRYMWRVGPMREIPVAFPFICSAGLDAFFAFCGVFHMPCYSVYWSAQIFCTCFSVFPTVFLLFSGNSIGVPFFL
jgi:hypothetical protein